MSHNVVIHGFETSNNMKVRVALGFKGIPYEFRTIDPRDRGEIVRISGQHLTPVMQHGDTVLFDSAAILRYLESNFPDTPRLFGTSHAEQWAIEDHELFARVTLAGPMMELVHHRVGGGTVDDEMHERTSRNFAVAAGMLCEAFGEGQWLVGESMTAADVTAGAVMYRIRKAEMFEMPEAVDCLAGWIDRVMAYDAHLER